MHYKTSTFKKIMNNFTLLTTFLLVLNITLLNLSAADKKQDGANLDEALIDAIHNDDLSKVRTLLNKGANPNAKGALIERAAIPGIKRAEASKSYTALMCATYHTGGKSLEIMRVLINKGASINEKIVSDRTAIMYTGIDKDDGTKKAKLLIEHGADIHAKRTDDYTALMYAAEYANAEVAKVLLEKGVDINAKDKSGRTALIVAASSARAEDDCGPVIKLLLEKGADIHATDEKGDTALSRATKENNIKAIRALQSAGATVSKDIFVAIGQNDLVAVKTFLEQGTDVNQKDGNGDTPLTLAARSGRLAIVDLLLEHGANPNLSGRGMPLDVIISSNDKVAEANDEAIVRALLKKGADANYSNSLPLRLAVSNGKVNIVKLLIQNGADVNAKDGLGNSVLALASIYHSERYQQIRKLLLDAGAKN